jgi:hypothetical protein
MMMLSLMLSSKLIASQITCKTPDGREVILKSNGKWEYADKKKSKANPIDKGIVKSQRVPLGVKFDSQVWEQRKLKLADDAEFSFSMKNGRAFAVMLNEENGMDPARLKELILEKLKTEFKDFRLIKEEDRFANGIPVNYLEVEGSINGIPTRIMYYFFFGKEETVQLMTFAPSKHLPAIKPELEKFLNGLFKV